jgi:hypothetical protein
VLERKEEGQGEEGERKILPEERVWQWRSGKIESKRKMNVCRAEWRGQRHRQARQRRKNQRRKEWGIKNKNVILWNCDLYVFIT